MKFRYEPEPLGVFWTTLLACCRMTARCRVEVGRGMRRGSGDLELTAGERLRRWRRAARLSQELLAERSGLGVRTVRDLEADRVRHPHPRSLDLLVSALALDSSAADELVTAFSSDRGPVRQSAGPARTASRTWGVPSNGPVLIPADLADFTGRAETVAELTAALRQSDYQAEAGGRPGAHALAPVCVTGAAGTGKTSIAVHVAQALYAEYPDGRLYVDLRGADPHPRPPADVLSRLLRGLDVDLGRVGDDLDDLAALYRKNLAGRRTLVLLDNAASEAQVRPLLPGGAPAAVLITSRQRLTALDSVRIIHLAPMDEQESTQLFHRIVGADRAAESPAATERIVRFTGGLPLALRLAGARASRPGQTIGQFAESLADKSRRLDVLEVADRGMRTSLALSYERLEPRARTAFRRIALLAFDEIYPWMIAALLDEPLPATQQAVDTLVDCHLLEPSGTGPPAMSRLQMHDLVRLFAAECLNEDDPLADQQAALARLYSGWQMLTTVAMTQSGLRSFRVSGAPRDGWTVTAGDPVGPSDMWTAPPELLASVAETPLRWLMVMHHNLVQTVDRSMSSIPQWKSPSEGLWWVLRFLSVTLPLYDSWTATHRAGLRLAETAGDPFARALHFPLSRTGYADLTELLRVARPVFAWLEDTLYGGRVRCLLARCLRLIGEPEMAAEQARAAERVLRTENDAPGLRHALSELGLARLAVDDSRTALDALGRALRTGHGSQDVPAGLSLRFADAQVSAGSVDRAEQTLLTARADAAAAGDDHTWADATRRLAGIARSRGDLRTAHDQFARAGEVFVSLDDLIGLTECGYGQAETLVGLERRDTAAKLAADTVTHWKSALPIWQAHGNLTYGIVAMACGDLDGAEHALGESAAVWNRLDSLDADVPERLLLEVTRRQARGQGF
jgi:hypothetical protein